MLAALSPIVAPPRVLTRGPAFNERLRAFAGSI